MKSKVTVIYSTLVYTKVVFKFRLVENYPLVTFHATGPCSKQEDRQKASEGREASERVRREFALFTHNCFPSNAFFLCFVTSPFSPALALNFRST